MHVLLLSLVIWFVGACFEAMAIGVRPYVPPDGTDVFDAVEGSWDWAGRPGTCRENPHTIHFTPDRAYMIFTYPHPIDSATGRREARYALRGTTAGSIRGFLLHEERRTEEGELVVWDLVLTGPDEYRWHRTDWAPGGYTANLIRCAGVAPPPPIPADSAVLARME